MPTGATSLAISDNEVERFRASGWHVQEIDGHDTDAIRDAITAARTVTDKPSMIACKTIIGFGLPTKAGTQKAHSDAPGEEEIAGARKILGWDSPPFVIPEPLLREWREIGAKGRAARMAWADRVTAAPTLKLLIIIGPQLLFFRNYGPSQVDGFQRVKDSRYPLLTAK